jgi:hypothetical protein
LGPLCVHTRPRTVCGRSTCVCFLVFCRGRSMRSCCLAVASASVALGRPRLPWPLMPACCCACAHHSRPFPQQLLLLPPPRCSALRCRLQAGLREAGKAMCLLTETQLSEPPAFIQMQPCWLASTVFVVTALMDAVIRPRECWRRCTTQLTRGQPGAL